MAEEIKGFGPDEPETKKAKKPSGTPDGEERVKDENPPHGGRWKKDPATGELVLVEKPTKYE